MTKGSATSFPTLYLMRLLIGQKREARQTGFLWQLSKAAWVTSNLCKIRQILTFPRFKHNLGLRFVKRNVNFTSELNQSNHKRCKRRNVRTNPRIFIEHLVVKNWQIMHRVQCLQLYDNSSLLCFGWSLGEVHTEKLSFVSRLLVEFERAEIKLLLSYGERSDSYV